MPTLTGAAVGVGHTIAGKETVMKKIFVAMLLGLLLIGTSINLTYAGEQAEILYTAYNIWKHDNYKYMFCVNFKSAPEFIPAGTPVYKARVHVNDSDPSWIRKNIKFRLVATDEEITIRFRKRWHPGIKVEEYFKMMFTEKKFEELTADFSLEEIDAIKQGIVNKGMRKKAVIVSYGYPPEHKTPSLDHDDWVYWMTTMRKKTICFDSNGKTLHCKDRQRL